MVTVAGELLIEPPTLINLGFEWFIQGDANRNATVAVSFRKQGDTRWRDALPLLRLQGERIYAESRVDVIAKSAASSRCAPARSRRRIVAAAPSTSIHTASRDRRSNHRSKA